MKSNNRLILSTTPLSQSVRKPCGTASLTHRQRLLYGRKRHHSTGKERDLETGLYYFGARYLDSRTGRWISGDPAMGEYVPSAPVNDKARKRNKNLPGQGGVFNYVNLHVYHYAGNNPVKYVDPDGETGIFPDGSPEQDAQWEKLMSDRNPVKRVRQKIASLARSFIGSKLWNVNVNRDGIKKGVNKCNIFVYEMTSDAGADPGLPNRAGKNPLTRYRNGSNTPPTAGQWASPDFEIPGWRVLSPDEEAMPGDVVAQKIDYSDATGHVAIVTGDGQATGTSNRNPEEVRETDWRLWDPERGPIVFRRWEGVE